MNENQIPKNGENKKIVLVYKFTDTIVNDKIFKKADQVVCPICKENCLMKINEYNITLFGCRNGHKKNILINEFNETQKINISDIICNLCKERNKGNTHNNEFYKCINCKLNICPLCKSNHNKNHNIINYDKINYICTLDNEIYNSYCLQCSKNICISCESEHYNHNMVSFGKMLKDKNAIIEQNSALRIDIDKFKNIIKDIINKLNMLVNNIEIYYEINKNIINNINNKNRNYEMLFNINNININSIQNDLKNIINENNINIQFNNIIKIYKYINTKKESNNINNKPNNIKYDEKRQQSVQILRKGSGISVNEQNAIISIAINVIQTGLKPISQNVASRMKKELGTEWIVIVYPHNKPSDFNLTWVKSNSYIYFTTDEFDFQICRIN